MTISVRTRILVSAAVIAFSAGLISMAMVNAHYDGKMQAVRKAHMDEVSALRRAHKKELKERDSALDLLRKIDRQTSGRQ